MDNAQDKPAWHQYKDAMSGSVRLCQQDKYNDALDIVDEAIAIAITEGDTEWICILAHHGAVISKFAENKALMKNYYEKSLTHDPENPRALYGLADLAREQGEPQIAQGFARRCYKAIKERDDEIARRGLVDLLLKHWPEIADE